MTYPYDANGNMTDIDGLTCTWDFKDRLVAVEDDTMRAEYTYDYTDRRIIKTVIPKQRTHGQRTASRPLFYVGKHFEVREHDAADQIRLQRRHPRRPHHRLPLHQHSHSTLSSSLRLESPLPGRQRQ